MIVKIKTWEQMEKEFGLTYHGYINIEEKFTRFMNKLLPSNRVINVEKDNHNNYYYIWYSDSYTYHITDEMIEKVLDPEKDPMYFI